MCKRVTLRYLNLKKCEIMVKHTTLMEKNECMHSKNWAHYVHLPEFSLLRGSTKKVQHKITRIKTFSSNLQTNKKWKQNTQSPEDFYRLYACIEGCRKKLNFSFFSDWGISNKNQFYNIQPQPNQKIPANFTISQINFYPHSKRILFVHKLHCWPQTWWKHYKTKPWAINT